MEETTTPAEELVVTGVGLLDIYDEESLTRMIETASKITRRYFFLLQATGVGKLSDEQVSGLVYDFHRKLWGIGE